MENQFTFRLLVPKDLAFLQKMFYTSLYVPDGNPPYPRSIIQKPGLLRYYQDWGRESDLGIVVSKGDIPIGATWSRFFTASDPGYGFVSQEIPEIGIAMRKEFRKLGIGTALLSKLLQELSWRGVKGASLSVDSRNQAVRLYRRLGFQKHQEEGFSWIMLKQFP